MVDQKGHDISMPPSVWGPIFWNTMHIVSLGYPEHPSEADKAGAKSFYTSLATVIPCPICREHYSQFLKDGSLEEAVQSKGQLIYWVWDVHNKVNVMLQKRTLTIDEFLDNMRNIGSTGAVSGMGSMGPMAVAGAVLAGAVVGAAGFWAYQKYRKSL